MGHIGEIAEVGEGRIVSCVETEVHSCHVFMSEVHIRSQS